MNPSEQRKRFLRFGTILSGVIMLVACGVLIGLPLYALSRPDRPEMGLHQAEPSGPDESYQLILDTRGAIAEVLTNSDSAELESGLEPRKPDLF
jgi:hypothetical protein